MQHNAHTLAHPATTPRSWPLVIALYGLLAIPAIPALLILTLLVIPAIDAPALRSMLHPAYLATPLPILLHGGTGVVFFLTIPLQFSSAVRQQYPVWHRVSGRLGLCSAYGMAASGIWMHHFLTPAELGMRYLGLWALTLAIVACFSLAFYRIRQRQFAAHQRWMYRALAAVLATITTLLLEVAAALTLGQLEALQPLLRQWQHDYARLCALGLNLLLMEWYLRRQAAQGLARGNPVAGSLPACVKPTAKNHFAATSPPTPIARHHRSAPESRAAKIAGSGG